MSNVVGIGRNREPAMEDAPEQDDRAEAEYQSLIGHSVEEILREGQRALFARLVGAVRSGTASHQQEAILRNLLKDNGLTLGIPPEKEAPATAPLPLPEYGDDE